jgi:hypothetical protein
VSHRASLDNTEKRKFLPPPDSNYDPLVIQLVASPYTDCAIPGVLLRKHLILSLYIVVTMIMENVGFKALMENYALLSSLMYKRTTA